MKQVLVLFSILLISVYSEAQTLNQSTMITTEKYGMTGKMKAKPGKGDDLAAILLKASELVSVAKGIHLYVVSKDASDPDLIYIFETWDSKEDHDNSLKLDGVKELISQAMPLMDGKPEGVILRISGGKGIQ